MPAEWEPHEACLMAWPTRGDLWEGHFEQAKLDYAATANAIARFEPVVMASNPGQVQEVRELCDSGVEPIEVPIDDSWARDSGPIFAYDGQGRRVGVDFRFNSWGERFKPYDRDAAMSARVLDQLEIDRVASEMVLEGGALTVDGEGTLITTEQCLLNPNRNPGMSREEIEDELRSRLGLTRIIWLPWGHVDDDHTDGHIDGVCAFVRPGVVISQTPSDPGDPGYEPMAANMEILRSSTDAAGRRIEVIDLPYVPEYDFDGESMTLAYANFYVANGGVVVPLADHPLDDKAMAVLSEAFPEREVVGVPGRVVSFGGGGPHCITQQIPIEARAG